MVRSQGVEILSVNIVHTFQIPPLVLENVYGSVLIQDG